MQEASVQLLLAEYDRLKALEQFRLANYERALQLYLTAITAATGVLVLLLREQIVLSAFHLDAFLLLGLIILIGEITFLSLVGTDIALTENAKAYLLIRDKFVQADPELEKAFVKGLIHDAKTFRAWSSFGSILARAFTTSQQKTIVVFLNCLLSAGIVTISLSPTTIWLGLAIGVGVAVIVGILHVAYASWRYKLAAKLINTGKTRYWA